jgi:exopolysaccharide production protein ExoZ
VTPLVDATSRRNKFGTIEVGRGVASALVIFHHAGNIMAQPRFYGAEPFWGHFRNFNVGVDFFFVLSGFIIAWIHWDDLGKKTRLLSYAEKRFLRIYPPYWGVLLPLVLLYLIFPNAGVPSQRDPLNIILSVFLLPYTVQPIVGVAWTLTHEILFYAVFSMLILLGRRSLIILPIWALAILAAHFAEPLAFPYSFFFSPFNLEFIMGVGAAAFLRHYRMPLPWISAAVGATAFFVLMLFALHVQDNALVGRLAFGVASVLSVLGAVEIERRHEFRIPKILLFLGASSYAVYLVHPTALSFGAQLLSKLTGKSLPLDVAAFLLFLIGLSAGCLYHLAVEPKLVAIARRAFSLNRSSQKAVQH